MVINGNTYNIPLALYIDQQHPYKPPKVRSRLLRHAVMCGELTSACAALRRLWSSQPLG